MPNDILVEDASSQLKMKYGVLELKIPQNLLLSNDTNLSRTLIQQQQQQSVGQQPAAFVYTHRPSIDKTIDHSFNSLGTQHTSGLVEKPELSIAALRNELLIDFKFKQNINLSSSFNQTIPLCFSPVKLSLTNLSNYQTMDLLLVARNLK